MVQKFFNRSITYLNTAVLVGEGKEIETLLWKVKLKNLQVIEVN